MSDANTFCKCDDGTMPIVVIDSSSTCPTPWKVPSKVEWEKVVDGQYQKRHGPRNRHERRAELAMRRRGLEWSR